MKNTINITNLSTTLKTQFTAKQEAIDAYRQVKAEFVDNVCELISNAPNGTVITCEELANQTGLTPCHVASIMCSEDYHRKGVTMTTVDITKRYAEIDDDGNIIEGVAPMVVTKSRAAYTKSNRRW